MNCSKLFEEVKGWLAAEKLTFIANEEETHFQVQMNLDHGLVPVRLLCEESPPMLQVICSIPVKVPMEKISGSGLLLHRLNVQLRVGSFQLDTQDGGVTFRLARQIHAESDMEKQFREAFGTALNTVDEHIRPLVLHFCSTSKSRVMLDRLNPPQKRKTGTKSAVPHARFELN